MARPPETATKRSVAPSSEAEAGGRPLARQKLRLAEEPVFRPGREQVERRAVGRKHLDKERAQ